MSIELPVGHFAAGYTCNMHILYIVYCCSFSGSNWAIVNPVNSGQFLQSSLSPVPQASFHPTLDTALPADAGDPDRTIGSLTLSCDTPMWHLCKVGWGGEGGGGGRGGGSRQYGDKEN